MISHMSEVQMKRYELHDARIRTLCDCSAMSSTRHASRLGAHGWVYSKLLSVNFDPHRSPVLSISFQVISAGVQDRNKIGRSIQIIGQQNLAATSTWQTPSAQPVSSSGGASRVQISIRVSKGSFPALCDFDRHR
jgi:hypothetical protein